MSQRQTFPLPRPCGGRGRATSSGFLEERQAQRGSSPFIARGSALECKGVPKRFHVILFFSAASALARKMQSRFPSTKCHRSRYVPPKTNL
jgi:hypothetical protein